MYWIFYSVGAAAAYLKCTNILENIKMLLELRVKVFNMKLLNYKNV